MQHLEHRLRNPGESIVVGGAERTSKGGTQKRVRRCQRSLWRFATRGAGVGTRDNMPYRRHLLVAAASDVAWPGYKRIAACMNRAARTRRGMPGIKSALSYYNRIMASSDPTPQKRPCRRRHDTKVGHSMQREHLHCAQPHLPPLRHIVFSRQQFFSFQWFWDRSRGKFYLDPDDSLYRGLYRSNSSDIFRIIIYVFSNSHA